MVFHATSHDCRIQAVRYIPRQPGTQYLRHGPAWLRLFAVPGEGSAFMTEMPPIPFHPQEDEAFEIRAASLFIGDQKQAIARLRDTGSHHHCEIVCFNADLIAGMVHTRAAMRHAVRSWTSGNAIANSFGMEALLFASASRQCQEATRFGLHSGENRIFIGIWPVASGVWEDLFTWMKPAPDGQWDEITPQKQDMLQKTFGITTGELAVTGSGRIVDLVLERVALLVVNR